MKKYDIKVVAHALAALEEISDYIAQELCSPQAAVNVLNSIRAEIKMLDTLPNRIPLVDEEPWHSEGIHKMVSGNYLVYFWIDEAEQTVKVLDVVYARRDQKKVLGKISK